MFERFKRWFRDERGSVTVRNLPVWVIAAIRTLTQTVIGLVLSNVWVINILTWVQDATGMTFSTEAISNAAFVFATAAVVALVNWLDRFPQVGKVVNTLISLFTSTSGVLAYKDSTDEGVNHA